MLWEQERDGREREREVCECVLQLHMECLVVAFGRGNKYRKIFNSGAGGPAQHCFPSCCLLRLPNTTKNDILADNSRLVKSFLLSMWMQLLACCYFCSFSLSSLFPRSIFFVLAVCCCQLGIHCSAQKYAMTSSRLNSCRRWKLHNLFIGRRIILS